MNGNKLNYIFRWILSGNSSEGENPQEELKNFVAGLSGISYRVHFNELAGDRIQILKINQLITEYLGKEQAAFRAQDLLQMLFSKELDREFLSEIFGKSLYERFSKSDNILATVSEDGHELRLWFEKPEIWKKDHISSKNKEILLFGIYHEKEVIRSMKEFVTKGLGISILKYPTEKVGH